MPFPCGLNVYITVEAVTLIGLAFIAATSFVINTTMAKKKKSGSAATKPPQLPGQQQPQQQQQKQQQKAVEAARVPADASGSVQEEGTAPSTPPPVIKETDPRPEAS